MRRLAENRALWRLLLVTAAAAACVSGACSVDHETADTVAQRVEELDGVVAAEVDPTGWNQSPSIVVEVEPTLAGDALVYMAESVVEIADEASYADSFPLTLRSGPEEQVTTPYDVGERLDHARIEAWESLRTELDGAVSLDDVLTVFERQPAHFDEDVAAAAGLMPADVTGWNFDDRLPAGGSAYTGEGEYDEAAAALWKRTRAATRTGPGLEVAGLDVWAGPDRTTVTCELDLGRQVAPARLTVDAYGDAVRPLATGLYDAAGAGDVLLSLRHGDDAFALFDPARLSAPDRDPQRRGWDAWLRKVLTKHSS